MTWTKAEEMNRLKKCLGRINWTKVLVNVGTEGEEEMLTDSQVYGSGIQEVDSLGIRRCRRKSQERSPRKQRQNWDSSAPRALGLQSPLKSGQEKHLGFRYTLCGWRRELPIEPSEQPDPTLPYFCQDQGRDVGMG